MNVFINFDLCTTLDIYIPWIYIERVEKWPIGYETALIPLEKKKANISSRKQCAVLKVYGYVSVIFTFA